MQKFRKVFNLGEELLAMKLRVPLGKMTGIEEATYPEFQLQLVTRFSDVWKLIRRSPQTEGKHAKEKDEKLKVSRPILKEHQRYAEKLRDADKIYAKKKLQRERERERAFERNHIFIWPLLVEWELFC